MFWYICNDYVGIGLPDGRFDEYANFRQRQFAPRLIFCASITRTVGDAGPYKNIAPFDNVFYCCTFFGRFVNRPYGLIMFFQRKIKCFDAFSTLPVGGIHECPDNVFGC